nr:carbamoyltransferase HypF [Clostridium aciditolerans]
MKVIYLKNSKSFNDKKRYLLKIYGIVQGVGFRPFVYKKAKEYLINGWVNNAGGTVVIDCSGIKDNLKSFILSLIKEPPSLAKIEKVECISLEGSPYEDFSIKESTEKLSKIKFVSPDVGTCPKCIEDIMKKKTDRYRYAFTNCTECGPRYSIIKALPYDRKTTTMRSFEMCSSCKAEYENPMSRRFHAQPNCCEKCGPTLTLINNKKEIIKCDDPVLETSKLIKQGKIIAIKGIGGFHLVCSGKDEEAIEELRRRKKRPHKPLALMMKDLETARKYCEISQAEEKVLTNNKRPIVLVNKKELCELPQNIAAKQNKLGIMLPYTPLHYLLFEEDIEVIVMTSGNISGEPIRYKNNEAIDHLRKVADYFLIHDREIHVPIDDSVVKVVFDKEAVIRRARGYSPYGINLRIKRNIGALGAEQKNTFCVSRNGYVYMSQYLGDLRYLDVFKNYQYIIKHLTNLLDIQLEVFAHDKHPDYLSTYYANKQQVRKISVQHHHAHMVSCMAEHDIYEPVIGVIYDGTGLGIDGAVWGGEFFIGTRDSFKRVAHLKYVSIQGGDKAIRETWRCALSYLYSIGYDELNFINEEEKEKVELVKQTLSLGLNCYKSSSMGRLFDCVAALIGIRKCITYDAQAAIELENIADNSTTEHYKYDIYAKNNMYQIDYKSIIDGVLKDLKDGEIASVISAKFHNTIVAFTEDLVCKIGKCYSLNKVVLSGGVFENQYLLKNIYQRLKEKQFQIFYNEQIPTNDGGISFGQLVIADAIIEKEERADVSCHTS